MKIRFKLFGVLAAGILFAGGMVEADTQPPPEGGVLPDIALSVPSDPDLQNYLGVTGKKAFSIPDIKADVVIVEIFSMY
jgi:hypothetical protein